MMPRKKTLPAVVYVKWEEDDEFLCAYTADDAGLREAVNDGVRPTEVGTYQLVKAQRFVKKIVVDAGAKRP